MGTLANTITLNGKVYDAVTGHPVNRHDKAKHHASEPAHISHKPHVKSVPKTARTSAQPRHRKPQHSKTLMRSVVKRPGKHADIRTTAELYSEFPAITTMQSVPVLMTAKDRSARAHHVRQSKLISKFGPLGSQPSFVMSVAEVPVQPHPESKTTTPPSQTSVHSKTTDALFTKALERAETKPQSKSKRAKKSTKSKAIMAGATGLSLLLLTGVVVMKSGPSMEFKLASARAGIQATLPGYTPAGYHKNGPAEYAPGRVVLHYQSNSDDRSYNITQQASGWNSNSLQHSVLGASTDFQTIQSKGRTIYLYDDGHAAWVDGGIWYQIDSAGSLSQNQLTEIVDGI